MSDTTAHVVKLADAREFFEGPELCRDYFHNDQMWFGTSEIEPGDVGGLDEGHPGSYEIFYCAEGECIVDDGTLEHPLSRGDILVIPPNVPHTVHNRSSERVVIAWAGAPGNPSAAL